MVKDNKILFALLIIASLFLFAGNSWAPIFICGDGIIDDPFEQCDDGNDNPGDGCDDTCQIEPGWFCDGEPTVCQWIVGACCAGDGTCQELSQADCLNAGDTYQGDFSICEPGLCQGCGNGILEGTEECDDGNNDFDITCTPTCKIPVIINNYLSFAPLGPSYYVDPSPNPAGCTGFAGLFGFDARMTNMSSDYSIFTELFIEVNTLTNGNLLQNADSGPGGAGSILTVPIPIVSDYSDGLLSMGEFADVPFDLCLTSFNPFSFYVDVWGVRQVCGNAVLEGTEECDDGNLDDGDGCDSNCTPTECGNGIVTSGEECDDGNGVDDDACSNSCTENTCGNNRVDPGEECDDGDSDDNNGCRNDCTDEDECAAGTDNCDVNATCTNTPGSFLCVCNDGYSGDGVTCQPFVGACCADDGTCQELAEDDCGIAGGVYDGDGTTCDPNQCPQPTPEADLAISKDRRS